MRSRVSVSRHVSRHRRHLRHPPDFVPALGPRHFRSQKVHSCSEQRGRCVIRRRRQPQKRSYDRIPLVEVRQHRFGSLRVQTGSCVNSHSQCPIRSRQRRLYRPVQLTMRERREHRPAWNLRIRSGRFDETHRNNLRSCRRQQRRKKYKHPEYCDPGPAGNSLAFHAVRIARSLPVRATAENF